MLELSIIKLRTDDTRESVRVATLGLWVLFLITPGNPFHTIERIMWSSKFETFLGSSLKRFQDFLIRKPGMPA